MTRSDVCIVSGTTRLRLPSPVNHKIYAESHGVDYRLECGPFGGLRNPYYFKLRALLHVLPRYEWVMWVDDDAFFTNFARDIRSVIASVPDTAAIALADGRVKSTGPWTQINSGVIIARNVPASREFFERCLETDTAKVESWWKPDECGMFTRGDQDTILFQMLTGASTSVVSVLPHADINAREYHYARALDEHFICHFAGLPDKLNAIRAFADRFDVDEMLVPRNVLAERRISNNAGRELLALPRRSFIERVRRRLR